MLKYTIKRIILIPFMLLVIALLIFLFLSLSKADAITQMLPTQYTPEDYYNLQHELGLDKPVVVQYLNWVWGIISKGDFGMSYKTRGPVWTEIGYRIPTTLKFAIVTTICTLLIGVPLGVLCAVKQYTLVDDITNVICKIVGSIPGFWLALVLLLTFSLKLKWLPTYGLTSFKHWILPVVTSVLPGSAYYMRQVRSSMLDCIRKDYVRTARSKGATERTVIYRDALRNALLPMITITGSVFALQMGGSVVIENVFALPGVGSKIVEAINSKDIPMIMASSMMLAIICCLMMLIIDLSYALVDPRIKATFVSAKRSKKTDKEKEKEAA
ncbi:MAG: ABC transporter permease [Oscillospiraceae bacterium]|nr:ABC transporter permease [Oscillospiraceae bacterium]